MGHDESDTDRKATNPAADAALVPFVRLMAGYERPWAVCGGWAIDLHLGRTTRAHKDVDIAVLRRDQLALQAYLTARGWTLAVAHDGMLTPWQMGEWIELPRHGIWCRNAAHAPDFLEVLLNEGDETAFRFRREPSLTLPLDRVFLRPAYGPPYLAPEVALLYKSGSPDLPENAADFRAALPALDATQRAWPRAGLVRL